MKQEPQRKQALKSVFILPKGASFRVIEEQANQLSKRWSKHHNRYFTSMKVNSADKDCCWTITDKYHPSETEIANVAP